MSHGSEPRVGRLLEEPAFAEAAAESVQALATPSRLRILARLHQAPAFVGELAEAVGMEGSAVSHQLRLLRHLGLVTARREGRSVRYELFDGHVAELLEQVIGHVEHLEIAATSPAAEPVGAGGAA